MNKKKPKLHFEQVSLEEVENLQKKKAADSDASADISSDRTIPKTELYIVPIAVANKSSR